MTDLGLALTHQPTTLAMGVSTGYVRITSIKSDGGMVTGDVRPNDVIVEAAGVNMRRPISEGMWKLTKGLMEVAPLPLEIVVAQEMTKEEEDEAEGKLTNQDTGMEEEKQTGFYQLVTPKKYDVVNDPVLSAKLYQLDDSCDFTSPPAKNDAAASPTPETPEEQLVLRNPFLDPNRFGPERTIVFRTESLGVKLNRSATEGIVHILHVTSYEPPRDSTSLSPRDGDIKEGDVIMEVGGVDLRNQFIGRLEWADMVHFIRYVERPLEMVVAEDGMFVKEKNVLQNHEENCVEVIYEEKKENTEQNQVENDNVEEKKADEENAIVAVEANVTEALRHLDEDCNSAVLDSVCGTVNNVENSCGAAAVDNICSAVTDGLCNSPGGDPTAAVEDMNEICEMPATEETEKNSAIMTTPSIKISPSNVKQDSSWIKSPTDQSEAQSPSRSPLFPRTHPSAERGSRSVSPEVKSGSGEQCNSVTLPEPVSPVKKCANDADKIASSPVPDENSPHAEDNRLPINSPETKCESNSQGMSTTLTEIVEKSTNYSDKSESLTGEDEANQTEEECMVPPRKSVAELKDLFSPIKVPSSSLRKEQTQSAHLPVAESDSSKSSGEESSVDKPDSGYTITEMQDEDVDKINEKCEGSGMPPVDVCSADDCKPTESNNLGVSDEISGSEKNKYELSIDDEDLPIEDLPEAAKMIEDGPIHQPMCEVSEETEMQTFEPALAEETNESCECVPEVETPVDETVLSSSPEDSVHDLAREVTSSSENAVQPSDSRDDIEHKKHRDDVATKVLVKPDEKSNVTICAKPDNKASRPPAKPVSTPAPANTFRTSLFVMDDTDSPFCGNIKFSTTPKERVPASALFSQAFVVQRTGAEESVGGAVRDNIRWETTTSPLFVVKKGAPAKKNPVEWSPYALSERTPPEKLFPDPLVKGFERTAFDMSELDNSIQVSDDGSLSDDPSYNPNDTIVYADETEAQSNCCGFDNFCADNIMFEGLVSNCGPDSETQRQTKEKANKVPSPRRKTILSRLRKGNKKNKDKVMYGNLEDETKESMKGIKKAHVQLRKQNLYGKSLEAASQYASMSDLIEI